MSDNERVRLYMTSIRDMLIIVALDLVTGILTSLGQTHLPNPFKQFANAYSVWLAVSFIIGVLMRQQVWALVGEFTVQLMALVGYYTAAMLFLMYLSFTYGFGYLARIAANF